MDGIKTIESISPAQHATKAAYNLGRPARTGTNKHKIDEQQKRIALYGLFCKERSSKCMGADTGYFFES